MSHSRSRSSTNLSHSFVDSVSQDDLIDYFPRACLLSIEKEIDIMNRIKREHQLSESGINEVGLQYVNEFRNNKQILFCIITPETRKIPFHEFSFTFNLYIPSWRASRSFNNRRNNRRNAYDSYQQIFLKYTFTANHQQINRIHTTIEYKLNNSGHRYFARKPYPQALSETIRKRKKYGKLATNTNRDHNRSHNNSNPSWSHSDLNEEMEGEQKYYKLPDLPSGKPSTSWWQRKNASTQNDLYEYSEYLQIIFNSPGLCIQDFIYDELEFHRDIKQVLQQKAQFKLNALIQRADKIYGNTIQDPKQLLAKQYKTQYNTQFNQNRLSRNTRNTRSTLTNSRRSRNMRSATSKIHSDYERPFMAGHRNRMDNITNINNLQNLDYRYHTVYIVSRPINYPALNMAGFNHWALKLEGINHLMTVGFCYDGETKESKINCNIIRNSKMNRRIFWYWWPRHYIPHDNQDEPQFFNTNWNIIDTVYLGTMSTECIGRLINRWLTKYGRYVTATNNCQHFVRDMISVMNIDVARKLPAFFDNKIITAIIPAAAAAGVMSEEARMLEVADMLSSEIEKYKNIIEERRERDMNEIERDSDSGHESDEFEDKRSNSIDSIAWNECAQFLNLSDDENDHNVNNNINNNKIENMNNNIDNGIIYNEYKDVEEEEEEDINSDGNSESKDDEKQEMENITPQNEMERSISDGMRNIMNKGLSKKSELIAKRNREIKNVNDEYSNIMNMIDEEMRKRGINEQYISDNND
eukprot:384145_1